METTVFNTKQTNPDFKRFDIPIKWGLVIGIVSCLLFTVINMFFLGNMMTYFVLIALSFIINIILLGVLGAQQRKAMGGYIEMKDAFQAIFVAILIIVTITYIYSFIYMKYIDPDYAVKMKEATLRFTEKMGAPQSKIDEASQKFDEQMKNRNSPAKLAISYVWNIVLYSFFGLICALIVRRKRPENMPQ